MCLYGMRRAMASLLTACNDTSRASRYITHFGVCHVFHCAHRCSAGEDLHLCFEGLDQLHAGTYGTSEDFRYCMDPINDVLIAYLQNDEPLTPDHGFPVRLILPGMVGGRQIKWLSRVWIQKEASSNWYHHHDNKLLPASVGTEAAAMAWWPRTAPYEMNCMAVITQPTHEEWINATTPSNPERKPDPLNPPAQIDPSKYAIKGFAYAGGGRRIIRVEVSLDEQQSWTSCMLRFVDGAMDEVSSAKSRNAKHWSWAHWELQVKLTAFHHAPSIIVRAFD